MFIEHEGLDTRLALHGLALYRCRYRADRYAPDLFDRYRIDEPLGLPGWARKRQAEFLAGRYCAARALEHAGQPQRQVAVGPHRAPLWPSGWRGAISHTDSQALAVASDSVDGVGIDLEAILDARQAAEFAPMIVDTAELGVGRSAGLDLPTFVSLAFSLKESVFKALYPQVGHYFGFEAAEITAVDVDAGHWQARLSAPLTARFGAAFPLAGRLLLEDSSVLTGMVLARTV